MKQQLLFLVLTFSLGLTGVQSQDHLSHTIYEEYDSFSEEYTEAMKQVYKYEAGRLKMVTYSYKDGADWIESVRNEFKYNGDGNLHEETYSTKMTGTSDWLNQRKNTTNYTGTRVTSEESFEWKNGVWEPDERTVLNYVGNRIETYDGYEWENMDWKADTQGVLEYEGNKIKEITVKEFKNGTWTFHDRDVYERSPSSTRIVDYISQDWNGTDWSNDEKVNYKDDTSGNREMETFSDSQDGITWEFENRIVYTYDFTELMSNYINPFSADKFSMNLGLTDAPHYNKVLSNIEYDYDDSDWEKSGRTTYYYSDVMGLDDLSDSNFLTIYPNPVKNTLHIKLKDQIRADASLFDINGRLVLEQKLQAVNSALNIEPLNSGIYILKIRTENGFATKRITKN